MRVASVGYTTYRYDPRVRRQCQALRRAGHRVFVLSLREEGEPRVRLHKGVCVLGVRTGRVRGGSLWSYVRAYFAYFLTALWWLARLDGRERLSVVHVNNMPNFMVFAALIPRFHGAGILLDVHDSVPELFATKFGSRFGPWLHWLLVLEERISARFAARVTCVNEPQRRLTATHGVPATKTSIIMNLPDDEIFTRPLPLPERARPFTLAYHGLLARRLGVDLVIAALGELDAASNDDYRFRIIGTGDAEAELRVQVAALGLERVVEFLGPVEPERIPELLKGVHLSVLPLRRDPATEIMLPTKLLEYLALGIPVVTVPTRCICHYFDSTTLRFLREVNPGSIARAIEEIRRDPSRWREMRRNGLDFARRHPWQDEARRYVELVESMDGRTETGVRDQVVHLRAS